VGRSYQAVIAVSVAAGLSFCAKQPPSVAVNVQASPQRSVASGDANEAHLGFGPLELLTPRTRIISEFGSGTRGKYCFVTPDSVHHTSTTSCYALLKYADDTVLVTFNMGQNNDALYNVVINNGDRVSGLAHFKRGVPQVSKWRWEGFPVLQVPPREVRGWRLCTDGRHRREYCGGPIQNPRAVVLSYFFHNGVVTSVGFGTE
jgi:hypothetical protein